LAAAFLAALAGAAPASAASTYTVTSFSDVGGSCAGTVCQSLRAAIGAAGANPGSTISLAAGTYQLAFGELAMNASASSGYAITIVGAGPAQTIIKQTGPYRVLDFQGGGPYLLKNLEITGGDLVEPAASGVSAEGGGVNADAVLDLDSVAIVGNSATGGSGISGGSPSGGANSFGGGLYEDPSSGTITIRNSTVSGNTLTAGAGGSGGAGSGAAGGHGFGGGVYISGQATIVGSTISGNAVIGGIGGGSTGSTPGNGGGADGGGLFYSGAELTVVNSTITANTASGGAATTNAHGTSQAGTSEGGGLDALGGQIMSLYSDTLAANTATAAGNLFTGTSMQAIVLNNNVFADGVASGDVTHTTNNCQIEPVGGLTIYDTGPNVETDPAPSSGPSACELNASKGDLFPSSAKLGPLADNGGPTRTMLPQAGSPLLRASTKCLDPSQTPAVPLTTDQRGDPRGSVCDIGAAQVQAAAATGKPTLSGTGAVGQTLTCSASGAFTGDGLSYAYSWLRNGAAIAGQTGPNYQLTVADAGTTVTCSVTATAIAGSPATASASITVAAVPAASAPAGSIGLLSKVLSTTGGTVSATLRCAGGVSGCHGTLRLSYGRGRKLVRLAGDSYSLASGKTEKLVLKLSARARRLLAAHHDRLSARLVITPSTGRALTITVTIRPAAKRKKH
jgi:hypothetical protein